LIFSAASARRPAGVGERGSTLAEPNQLSRGATMKEGRKIRKMTVVIWVWCLAILAWAIAGGASGEHSTHCHGQFANACQQGTDAGTAIGVGLILFVGFFGFVFLSIIWFMTRPKPQAG
jgi:hypothetical protein